MLPLKNIKFFKIEILYMVTNDQGNIVYEKTTTKTHDTDGS